MRPRASTERRGASLAGPRLVLFILEPAEIGERGDAVVLVDPVAEVDAFAHGGAERKAGPPHVRGVVGELPPALGERAARLRRAHDAGAAFCTCTAAGRRTVEPSL